MDATYIDYLRKYKPQEKAKYAQHLERQAMLNFGENTAPLSME